MRSARWSGVISEAFDEEAVITGLRAGCDLECGKAYSEQIERAVKRGVLAEGRRSALGRVLGAFCLGMFDPPGEILRVDCDVGRGRPRAPSPRAGSARESRFFSRMTASTVRREENEEACRDRPAANVFLHGSSGYHGTNGHLITPHDGIVQRAGSTMTVSFVPAP